MTLNGWLALSGVVLAFFVCSRIALNRHYHLGSLLRAFIDDQRARARLLTRVKRLKKLQEGAEGENEPE